MSLFAFAKSEKTSESLVLDFRIIIIFRKLMKQITVSKVNTVKEY